MKRKREYDGAVLGIDMSITSPGFVVCEDNIYHMYFLPQRGNDTKVTLEPQVGKNGSTIYLHPLKRHSTTKDKFARYNHVDICLEEILAKHPNINKVRIEGYAFNAEGSASMLFELGGIIRYRLWKAKIEWVELPPSKVKKLFSGHGKAGKVDMWEAYLKKGYPNLLELFGLKVSERKHGKHIPHPVEDIVDGLATLS